MTLRSTTALSPISGEFPTLQAPVIKPKRLTSDDVRAALRSMRDGFAVAYGNSATMPDFCMGQLLSDAVTQTEFRELMRQVWSEK